MRTELFRVWHGRKRRWSDEQRTLIERLLDTLAQLATGLSVMQDRTLFVDAGDNPPREELRAALASF